MLTIFQVQRAQPQEKPYKLSDGQGLHLLIEPTGSKLWRFRYQFERKEKMLSFGKYPDVSLAAARDKRDAARKLIADGKDPSQKRQEDKAKVSETFGVIAEEYIQKLTAEGAAFRTLEKNKWLLTNLAGELANKPIREVSAAELLSLLKKVEKSGRRDTARRLRGTIGSVFRYAIATLRADTDPTFALRGALQKHQVTHRAAITDEGKLGALMVSIDEYDGWPTLKAALQFLPLTMARPVEVRLMRRSEVNFIKAVWNIPAERMKMRRPHDVPLSSQALEVLRSIWELSEGDGLVFPSIRSSKKPLSENALNSAMRRMGYTKEEHTAHGFRSSASTILNERGYAPDVIETALAHLDADEVRRAYNRSKYYNERQKMLQDWADLLDQFRQMRIQSHVG